VVVLPLHVEQGAVHVAQADELIWAVPTGQTDRHVEPKRRYPPAQLVQELTVPLQVAHGDEQATHADPLDEAMVPLGHADRHAPWYSSGSEAGHVVHVVLVPAQVRHESAQGMHCAEPSMSATVPLGHDA